MDIGPLLSSALGDRLKTDSKWYSAAYQAKCIQASGLSIDHIEQLYVMRVSLEIVAIRIPASQSAGSCTGDRLASQLSKLV
jgi:hypothetical protein